MLHHNKLEQSVQIKKKNTQFPITNPEQPPHRDRKHTSSLQIRRQATPAKTKADEKLARPK